jgi:hypothetical protein
MYYFCELGAPYIKFGFIRHHYYVQYIAIKISEQGCLLIHPRKMTDVCMCVKWFNKPIKKGKKGHEMRTTYKN